MAVVLSLGTPLRSAGAQRADSAPRPAGGREAFVAWAVPRVVPVADLDRAADSRDLRPLGAMIGTARVVALGEPAHGAHEPLAFRNRLLRYLVEERGFTAIALESGLPESRALYDYVLAPAAGATESDTGAALRRTVRTGLTYGFGALAENVALVGWVRAYNADARHARKVRLYGMDLSFAEGPADTAHAHLALDEALAFLERVDGTAARTLRARLAPVITRFSDEGYPALTAAERDALGAALDALVAQLERGRPAYVARSSATDVAWALRNAAVARWTERTLAATPSGTPTTGVQPAAWRAAEMRDAAMADDVRWVLAQEGPSGRVVVFAHDGHVKNARTAGGIWDAFEQAPFAMGAYLRAALGDDVFLIGTSGAAQGPGLPPVPAVADSLDVDAALGAVVHRARVPRFVLDVRPARTTPAAAWLASPRLLRANFRTVQRLVPATAYDALFVVDTLTAPRFAPQP